MTTHFVLEKAIMEVVGGDHPPLFINELLPEISVTAPNASGADIVGVANSLSQRQKVKFALVTDDEGQPDIIVAKIDHVGNPVSPRKETQISWLAPGQPIPSQVTTRFLAAVID